MKKIKLNNGMFALIDDEDFLEVAKHKWHFDNGGYARCQMKIGIRKQRPLLMHRLIMRPEKGLEVDHIDGNKLNNQKSNLRICRRFQNSANRKLSKNNTSGYKGVTRQGKKWIAQIGCLWKHTSIGSFDTAEEAARAYDRVARDKFGKYARTNF